MAHPVIIRRRGSYSFSEGPKHFNVPKGWLTEAAKRMARQIDRDILDTLRETGNGTPKNS